MSLMRKHKQRVLAEKAALKAQEEGRNTTTPREPQNSPVHILTTRLRALEVELKGLQSTDRKIKHKLAALPEFDAYLDGIVAADTKAQDDILVMLMIWHFDCVTLDPSLLQRTLDLADYALQSDMKMPDRFNRSLAGFVLAELADIALATSKLDDLTVEDRDLMVEHLNDALTWTKDHDMVDDIPARAYKAMGELIGESNIPDAISALEEAHRLDSKKAGVQTKLKQLKKLQEKQAENQDANKQNTGTNPQ
ncbi:phage terminase small subunit [Kiloniella sp. b19]|uniref:phage terminase small subunit n=1 Tax=Kiloniella sp. GXU_MW_B19 TaxID=3141326 RepID=UPI0031D01AD8